MLSRLHYRTVGVDTHVVVSITIRPETSNISLFNLKLYLGTVFHKRSPASPAACQGLNLSETRAHFDSSRKLRCVRAFDFHSALGSMFVALSQNTAKWFVSTMYRRSCKKNHARCHVSWRLTAQGIRQHAFADKILEKFRFPCNRSDSVTVCTASAENVTSLERY